MWKKILHAKVFRRNPVLSTVIGISDSHEQKFVKQKKYIRVFLNITGTWVDNKLATGHQRKQPLRRNKQELCNKIFHTLLQSNVHQEETPDTKRQTPFCPCNLVPLTVDVR